MNHTKRAWLRTCTTAWLATVLAGCSAEKPSFQAVDITGADYAQAWALADHNGQLRSLQDFAGKVVVMFFGYTQCPDVCPATLQELQETKRLLGADGHRLQVLFVTMDPERDTPELLAAYMANFDAEFLALRPAPDQVAQVAKALKIYAKKVEGKTPTSYTVDHSAHSYIYDPKGRLRLYSRYASGAQALADDARRLLKGQ